MKSLKKSVTAVLVIGTLSVAGMAFAQHHGNGQNGPMEPFGGPHHMEMRQWNGDNPQPMNAPCDCAQNFCGRGFGHQDWRGPCGGQFQQRGMFAPNMPQGFCGQGFGQGRGPAFGNQEMRGPRREDRFQRHGRFRPDMPQEIRAKAVEAAKLRIDLENVLSQKPLNRDKALELNGQIGKLEQEIRAWRFEQKLNRIEEWNKKPVEQDKGNQDK